MKIVKAETIASPCVIGILLAALSMLPAAVGHAVSWQALAHNSRHDIALDKDAVRLTSLGRLAVWLRFMPLGELQRRQAATDYGQKHYRFHLEYYEIDCSEQTAMLGQIDVLGPDGRRLARLKGNGSLDAILPGSVLDIAAQQVCAALEEKAGESGDEVDAPDSSAAAEPGSSMSDEARRAIAEALVLTTSNPGSSAAWKTLGNAYYDADQPQLAIEAYTRALKLDPSDPDVLNDLGAMYRQIGDFERAVANFEQALALAPTNLESLYNLAYVYAFDLNRIDKALTVWHRYVQLDSVSETGKQVQGFIQHYSPKPPRP